MFIRLIVLPVMFAALEKSLATSTTRMASTATLTSISARVNAAFAIGRRTVKFNFDLKQ